MGTLVVLAGLGAFFWGWTGFIAGLVIWVCIEIIAFINLLSMMHDAKKEYTRRGINWDDIK